MTIELKLDTNALSHLIDQDPEFRLKLQQCVLENIATRYIKGTSVDLQRAVEAAAEKEKKDLLSRFGTYERAAWSTQFKLNAEIHSDLRREIQRSAQAQVDQAIKDAVEKATKSLTDTISSKVSFEVNRQTNNAVAAEVKSRVEAALSKLKL